MNESAYPTFSDLPESDLHILMLLPLGRRDTSAHRAVPCIALPHRPSTDALTLRPKPQAWTHSFASFQCAPYVEHSILKSRRRRNGFQQLELSGAYLTPEAVARRLEVGQVVWAWDLGVAFRGLGGGGAPARRRP